MRRQGLFIPLSILLFLLLVLAGAYFVRKAILERAMVDAMTIRDEGMMKSLLNCWPSPVHAARTGQDEDTPWSETVLRWAIDNGDPDLVRLCLAKGASVEEKEEFGSTPLFWTEDPEIIGILLRHGADVNARDKEGLTPLMSVYSRVKAELLLAHGADVNARSKSGQFALNMALHNAGMGGCKDPAGLLRVFMAKGADPNARDEDGWTPLHLAVGTAVESQSELVRLLLEHGADPNIADKDGKTPLDLALDMLKANPNGETPEFDEVIQILCDHGAKE